jgi:hypothetical protein
VAAAKGRLLLRQWLPGIADPIQADVSLTATWEKLQIQFTPTEAGVFELVFQAWNTALAAGNVWIDDIDIIQAAA